MDVHPLKNGMYRYWSIANYVLQILAVADGPRFCFDFKRFWDEARALLERHCSASVDETPQLLTERTGQICIPQKLGDTGCKLWINYDKLGHAVGSSTGVFQLRTPGLFLSVKQLYHVRPHLPDSFLHYCQLNIQSQSPALIFDVLCLALISDGTHFFLSCHALC